MRIPVISNLSSEYLEFVRATQLPMSTFSYVNDFEHIAGFRPYVVVLLESWLQIRDLHKVMSYIRSRDPKPYEVIMNRRDVFYFSHLYKQLINIERERWRQTVQSHLESMVKQKTLRLNGDLNVSVDTKGQLEIF